MTHSFDGSSEMCTDKKSLEKTLRGTADGLKKILPVRAVGVDGLQTLVHDLQA
jgi:hypothetical protein